MQWMVVDLSLEEQLVIESQARIALHHPDKDEVAKLCNTLIKQNAYQAKLLKQAINHIASLEANLQLKQLRRPWWKLISRHH
jgi:hypothetical protein